jgi:hypothetical protein
LECFVKSTGGAELGAVATDPRKQTRADNRHCGCVSLVEAVDPSSYWPLTYHTKSHEAGYFLSITLTQEASRALVALLVIGVRIENFMEEAGHGLWTVVSDDF